MTTVDDLSEAGIEIPSDPAELAKLAEELGVDLEGVSTTDPEQIGKPDAAAPDKAADPDKGAPGGDPDKGKQQPDPAKAADPGKTELKDEPGDLGPPKAVLRRERENRHRAEQEAEQARDAQAKAEQERDTAVRRVAELEAKTGAQQDKLQAAADRITGDPSLKLEKLDPAALELLKRDLDDDAVNLLTRLTNQHNALQEQLERMAKANEVLLADREQARADSQQDDIDSVPLLSMVQATRTKEADALWNRAVAYEKALTSDPDWADKSRREKYQEVGRRIEAHLGKDVPEWLSAVVGKPGAAGSARDRTVEDKLAAARNKATPDSLSDLPAGLAAAQHETERLEAMSDHDVDAMIDAALKKGPEALEALTARMMTADR